VLGLRVRLGGKHLSQFAVPRSRDRFTIGSHGGNALVLRDGNVEPFACVLARTGEIWSIEPFQGRLDGHCRQSSARCTQDWETLKPTADPSVRRCAICSEHVHYAGSCAEGNEHARSGRCFVLDLVELRRSSSR
jgi:hypothetical protein